MYSRLSLRQSRLKDICDFKRNDELRLTYKQKLYAQFSNRTAI